MNYKGTFKVLLATGAVVPRTDMWRSETAQESVLSFLRVGLRNQTHVVSYQLSDLACHWDFYVLHTSSLPSLYRP